MHELPIYSYSHINCKRKPRSVRVSIPFQECPETTTEAPSEHIIVQLCILPANVFAAETIDAVSFTARHTAIKLLQAF